MSDRTNIATGVPIMLVRQMLLTTSTAAKILIRIPKPTPKYQNAPSQAFVPHSETSDKTDLAANAEEPGPEDAVEHGDEQGPDHDTEQADEQELERQLEQELQRHLEQEPIHQVEQELEVGLNDSEKEEGTRAASIDEGGATGSAGIGPPAPSIAQKTKAVNAT
jgi:hypothetical protein